jgi:hypothetical protein
MVTLWVKPLVQGWALQSVPLLAQRLEQQSAMM